MKKGIWRLFKLDFDDLLEFDVMALALALVFSFLMYFFMFEMGEVWVGVPTFTRVMILFVGFPVYYFIALMAINK